MKNRILTCRGSCFSFANRCGPTSESYMRGTSASYRRKQAVEETLRKTVAAPKPAVPLRPGAGDRHTGMRMRIHVSAEPGGTDGGRLRLNPSYSRAEKAATSSS